MGKNIGLKDGKLNDCPSSPNCVCSQAKDVGHQIAPLSFSGDLKAAQSRLKKILQILPRTHFVREESHYWHVEFTTALLKFVDDVEFLFTPGANQIQIRSASRLGHGDLGTNRRRMEDIRQRFKN